MAFLCVCYSTFSMWHACIMCFLGRCFAQLCNVLSGCVCLPCKRVRPSLPRARRRFFGLVTGAVLLLGSCSMDTKSKCPLSLKHTNKQTNKNTKIDKGVHFSPAKGSVLLLGACCRKAEQKCILSYQVYAGTEAYCAASEKQSTPHQPSDNKRSCWMRAVMKRIKNA
jgi:hypothetical protein